MTRYPYPHPGYGGKLYPIRTVLRDLSAQENCNGEPYDVMVRAAEVIEELERRLDEARNQRDKLADALVTITQIPNSEAAQGVMKVFARNALRGIGACPNCGGSKTSTLDGACAECGSEK